MIAHLDNGKSTEIRPGAATMGLRVVRWEFDFNDMRELLKNPELLPILFTRMPPTSPQREMASVKSKAQPEPEPTKLLLIPALMEQAGWVRKREWQGLTDEEKVEIQALKWWDWEDTFDLDGYTRAIEAKLKEKNA